MKYVFVIPKYLLDTSYYSIPMGLGYIISVLKKSGRTVECINLNERDSSQDKSLPPSKRNRVFLENYSKDDIVLTGGLSVHYRQVKNIVAAARAVGCRSIIGGGVISAEPEYMFELIKPTYGVIGEGEETILELAECIEKGNDPVLVKGILYQKDGKTVRTETRLAMMNIDDLPFPDYNIVGIPELLARMNPVDEPYFQSTDFPRMIPMITSRSCPYRCSFCFHPLGDKYRRRGLDSIFKEIDHWVKIYQPNIFMFLDELFNEDMERLIEFCRRIKPYGVHWICQMRVPDVDSEILSVMREAGCNVISYGIESINDGVLKAMRKQTTRVQIERALELTYNAGIGIQGNFIFGTDAETVETYQETLKWWEDHQKYMLNLVSAQTYPGTRMYELALEKNRISSKELFLINSHQVLNITDMTDNDYWEMTNRINRIHHSVNENVLATDVQCRVEGFSAGRGKETLTINYTCPHCRERIELKNILRGVNPMGRGSFRFACRKCNQRADMELKI